MKETQNSTKILKQTEKEVIMSFSEPTVCNLETRNTGNQRESR